VKIWENKEEKELTKPAQVLAAFLMMILLGFAFVTFQAGTRVAMSTYDQPSTTKTVQVSYPVTE
jgi:TRAP-type C4-dicarboxylate transport system permease small subunit